MYIQQRFVLMALDPVHIGTGGYRLGRVDLSIAREPGTNLPKIPGTSLAGAARSYAAMRYEQRQCAGQQSGDKDKEHSKTCPICYTFGAIRGSDSGNAGTVSLADAQLLLFPVHSLAGPMWVTTATRLNDAGFTVELATAVAKEKFATTLPQWNKSLNLGWLLLEYQSAATVQPPEILRSASSCAGAQPRAAQDMNDSAAWGAIEKRLVLVDDGLFSHIVNSNLEVRTSVSIDPNTGAAKDGALFTYEALPRTTWLWCDVVEDDYRTEKFPQDHPKAKEFEHQHPLDVVRAGLKLAEYLGIGGMGTRGFGRIQTVGDWKVSP